MQRIALTVVLVLAAAGAFALPGRLLADDELNAEITAILGQKADTQLGTMTVGDLEALAGQVSISVQKEQYIRHATVASLVLPGAGQFMVGDVAGGSLFLAGDIAVLAGAVVGSYFLLPANVQFGQLDYLNAPFSTIKNTWQSNSFMDYLPSLGVMAGGAAVEMLLRWLSAENAKATARSNVESGKVTFQPKLLPLFDVGPDGRVGIGFRLRMGK